MNTHPSIEERLWDYIDGHSLPQEKSAIEQLIQSNIAWRNKYQELLDVHQLMSNSLELDEPSMRFTQNVMEDIAKYHIAPAAQSYINKRIIWGIASFFILTILGFLIYSFGRMNWSDSGGASTLPFDSSRLKSIDFSKFLNNTYTNIFLMVNAVLGLVLLDMYLSRKKKQLPEKH
jgi:magnesium-transporting ATPase (P-type)